jgi:flagellar biosynthesis/type III secretory pathway chaperone
MTEQMGKNPVESASEDLCLSMEKALELIGRLTETADNKAGCLTAGDIEGLRVAMEDEEELIAALDQIEKDRMIKADALSQAIGLFSQNIRLSELEKAIPDRLLGERLHQLGERLTSAVTVLTEKNGTLKELLQLQIGCNEYLINMLVAPKEKNNAYNFNGSRKENQTDRGFLDVHI